VDGSEKMGHRCPGRLHPTNKSTQIEIRARGNEQDRKAQETGNSKRPSQKQTGKKSTNAGDYMPRYIVDLAICHSVGGPRSRNAFQPSRSDRFEHIDLLG
jgi:hypothetical protein